MMDNWQDGLFGSLILGAYAWTYGFVTNRTKNQATKDDVEDLRERVNLLYEHLLHKPIPMGKDCRADARTTNTD